MNLELHIYISYYFICILSAYTRTMKLAAMPMKHGQRKNKRKAVRIIYF